MQLSETINAAFCALLWLWYLLICYCKPNDFYNNASLSALCVIQLSMVIQVVFCMSTLGHCDELISL